MSDALERLRQRNRADVTLASGLRVGLQLVGMREIISAGQLPTEAIQQVLKENPDLTPDQVAEAVAPESDPNWLDPQRALVAACVRTVDGEEVTLSPEDTSVFSDEEFFEIVSYAMRSKALPGLPQAPTSPDSPSATPERSTEPSASSGEPTPEPRSKTMTSSHSNSAPH